MWRLPRNRSIAVLTLLAAAKAVFAGSPSPTDDPEPVDLHHIEVNVIGQQTRAVAGGTGSLSEDVNVGFAAETQCHIASSVAFDTRAGDRSCAGLGDIEFGVTYSFYHQSGDGWSAADYPTVYLRTGNACHGLGAGSVQLLLPLWVQRSIGDWSQGAGTASALQSCTGCAQRFCCSKPHQLT